MLTSAHVVARTAVRVEVFQPGGVHTWGGVVVWCGTPGGRDDAALVLLDDDPHRQAPAGAVRWGRLVTDRPGTGCETWGLPDVAQQSGAGVEAVQLQGRMNAGSGFVGNRHVMDLVQHPPRWWQDGTSPWGGLSGAAVFCGRLLAGVVASDRAHSGHGQLNAVPAYALHHDLAFRAVLAEHGGGAAGLEAVEFQHLADSTAFARRAQLSSPAALLQAGRQTVPFHGREELLERLRGWCALGGFGAWLLHGPGGQGKTRLAYHLAGLLAADGWAVLWPGAGVDDDRLREVRDAARPLLVVLDYAETRTAQLTALVEAASDHPGTSALKVLLLARTGGDWWTHAKTATSLAEDYLDNTPSVRLAPLEDVPGLRPAAYRTAARALAAVLSSVHGLAGHDWHTATDSLPVPDLDADGYANVLTLQMTALADLLDTAAPAGRTGAGGEETEEVEDRLLGHERRYWKQSAAAHGLTPQLSLDTLEAALAAAHLAGAADRGQADHTWRRLPALADQVRDRRDAVTAWIASLYPTTISGLPWGALQPDRLAERHIGRVLDTDPVLAERLLDGADDAQTARLLTVYSRAAAHPVFHGRLDAHLTGLCTRHHHQIAARIITTAIQADYPAPLITALDTLTTDPTIPHDTLTALHDRFPHSSQRLARTAMRLSQTITGHYRTLAEANPDAYLPDLAMSLNNLSVRLGEAGRRAEGLAASQEAVRVRRTLAEASPDAYLPDLAMSLNNLSIRLGEVGRREEGLAASQEAVRVRRTLAEASPDAYLPDLAMSLNNLSIRLGEAGRREEGLAAIQEATGHYRTLAEASPDAYLPDLAMSLNNLSVRLGEVGRREEGLAAIQEATGHYRTLAEASPDAYLPDLAMSLNNLSVQLGEVGRREEGLAAIQEATGHYRTLAETNPDAYLPNLAASLNNLAVRLGEVGRREEGLAAIQEAVHVRRTLAETNPDAYLPDLATSLNNLSIRLGEAGRREEGLAAIQEATGHYRTLAESSPDAYLPDLAMSLNNLSVRLGEVGRREEGLAAIQEAVRIRRTLAETNPDAYLPDLATSLNNLSVDLGEAGRREEGLAAIQEATGHYRTLAEASPDAYLPDLAMSLNNLSVQLGEAGRREEGLAAIQEAVRIRRTLAETNPDAYLPDLATSLNNLSVQLGEAGRREEGLAAIQEATGHYRTLAEASPERFQWNLQGSLKVAAWLESLPQ
ncbi:tetratricopeptide repeat protein [Streptomyces sp. NBC_01240]|uniref:tetratricopeptide repeat protein n=1 Tax=Streptomyces sp. NBC_01240 TaxID=2903793 RepID=UPI002E155133|nr:tetratricopeptide repeat protein [Streptomyces sp. NBC_01240]